MGDTVTSLQYDVAIKLRQIADSFVEDTFRENSVFCGQGSVSATGVNFNESTTSGSIQEFVQSLMKGYTKSGDNRAFKNLYGSSITTTTVSKFHYRDVSWNTTHTSYLEQQIDQNKNTLAQYFGANVNCNLTRTVEISLKEYVTTTSALASNLNSIRQLYSALDETNYKNYVYYLKNPDAMASCNVTAKNKIVLVNYFGDRNSNVQTNVSTIKTLINSLRGNSTLTTSLITNPANYDSNNLNAPSLDASLPNSQKPAEAKSEDVYEIVLPNKWDGFTLKDLPIGKITGTNNTSYSSISFYAKMKGDNDNATTANVKLTMFVNDETGGTRSYKSTSLRQSEEKVVTLNTNWQRISLTRKMFTSSGVKIDIKANIQIVKNDSIPSEKHVVQIVGLQADIQKEDSYGALPAYRLPMFDDSKTNRIAVRRLLLLYELMATYYIAVYIMDINWANNSNSRSLVNVVYDYMMNFSRNMIRQGVISGSSDPGSTLVGTLTSGVATKISDFQKNIDDITIKSSTLTTGQTDLKSRVSYMTSEKDKSSRTYTYMVVALVLFLLVVVACVIIFLLPIEQSQKVSASVGVASVGIITLLIFHFVYSIKVENFQAYLSNPDTAASGLSISNQTNFTDGATIVALGYAVDYLENTIQIALMVQTYIGYNNMNGALQREKVYYDEVNSRLDLSKTKVDSARNIYALERYTNRARVSFFVSVGILVALTVALLIGTSKYPIARPIILGVAGFILFLAILFYLLDTSARVRTHSNKIYWGTPNISSL